jgi:hypothetical protein
LFAVAWPAVCGYLFEALTLVDLSDSVPLELVFGAPSARLSPHRRVE